jgi:Xaa-Pro aminopeptidase
MIFEKFLSLLPPELDGALVMSEENRRYFTSFPSSDGALLISRNGTVFLTDSRYVETAQKKITVCPVRLSKNLSTELPQLMSEFKINNLAVETTRLTVAQFEDFTKWMPDTGICTENYADRAIDALRMVKSDEEVALVCEAQAIAERAFDHILGFIKPGVTERDIQLELDYYMLRNGAEALSFETIAVSGVNSSMPHGVPSDKKVESGEFITMDYGAVVGGYHSDMTRTVAVGSVSAEQKKIYNTVLEAQLASMEKMAPGVSCFDADKAARDVITEAGYGEFFGHGTGHGVGVEIHEQPRVSPHAKKDELLAPGHLPARPLRSQDRGYGAHHRDGQPRTHPLSQGAYHTLKILPRMYLAYGDFFAKNFCAQSLYFFVDLFYFFC